MLADKVLAACVSDGELKNYALTKLLTITNPRLFRDENYVLFTVLYNYRSKLKYLNIDVEFENTEHQYIMLEFWMKLPEGVVVDKDEDGDKPTAGQFQQAAMTPHTEQLRMFAGMFAGETGLTLDDLGFPQQNPSSSEAIRAAHETLRLMARKAQRDFGVGLLNAGYLAACVRDDYPYLRRQVSNTQLLWAPIFEPDITALSGVGDAVQKIQTSFPEYFTEDKLRELTGI